MKFETVLPLYSNDETSILFDCLNYAGKITMRTKCLIDLSLKHAMIPNAIFSHSNKVSTEEDINYYYKEITSKKYFMFDHIEAYFVKMIINEL